MTTTDPIALMKGALLEIERLQRKLSGLEQQIQEPIAVVGMGCRFAGANSPDELWQRLLDGADGVREVPSDRWDIERYFDADPDAVGRIYCRCGSFLDDIASFDAGCFGISAREAAMLDPQQRLLLEVVWEAIERAGMPVSSLKGTKTGVFVGVMHQDYAHRFRNVADVDLYTASGNAPSVLAGRVSHSFGLNGPSLSIDTACSSSLVAVHQACAALRARECDIAIVAGVNVVLSTLSTAAECRAHMLSPSGRCRSFDDGADGFVRGEGCGVVVLQRHGDAEAGGRTIEALIAGSAVNHDGRSAGLTVPNERAQRDLVRAALRAARIDPAEVQFIEAHGTGTPLGDPIEAAALASVFASRGRQAPVLLGSIKSNLGHLEGAAGIAGLIKAVLSVRHGVVPATLHVREPNRGIDWAAMPLRLATQNERFGGERRVAGVSSFGFSGTNAHAVVVSAPSVAAAARQSDAGSQLLTISAKTDAALRGSVLRFADRLARIDIAEWADFCHSSRVARSHFPHRVAVIADQPHEMADALRRFVRGEASAVESGVVGAMPVAVGDAATDSPAGLSVLARRYVTGVVPDWAGIAPDDARIVPLPTYAFDRQRYWLDERADTARSPLYHLTWGATRRPASTQRAGRRIVAGDDPALCMAVAEALERAGERCEVLAGDLEAILAASDADLGLVLVFGGAAAAAPVEAIAQQGAVVIGLAQALSARPSLGPVTVVTRGAVGCGPSEHANPVTAAVNAAVRVARREQGRRWGRSIDIDDSAASLSTLADLLGDDADEEEVAVRGSSMLAPRLRRAGAGETMPDVAADATYVITGGTGALGLATARWLARRGARHLLLVSRRGETADAVRAQCDQLRAGAVEVCVASADVADEAELRRALACATRPIRGVIHCAGTVDDVSLDSMSTDRFDAVLRAKVGGADLLNRLTEGQPLDLFLLFSSLSVVVGRHGQAAYAAANAYLDALAQRRCAAARPALSIGWGMWSTGMATEDRRSAGRMRAGGLDAMTEAEAFAALELAFIGEPHVIIAAIDTQRIAGQANLPSLVEGLIGPRRVAAQPDFDIERLRGKPAAQRRAMIADHLDASLRTILSSAVVLPRDASLLDLGVDSLTGAELRNTIERSTGMAVQISRLVDGSSLETVIDLVSAQVEHYLVTRHASATPSQTEEINL